MGLSLNYQILSTGSDGLSTLSGEIMERLDELHSELKNAAESWSGEALTAYQVNQQAFNEELDKLRNILGSTGVALTNASTNAQERDTYLARRLSI